MFLARFELDSGASRPYFARGFEALEKAGFFDMDNDPEHEKLDSMAARIQQAAKIEQLPPENNETEPVRMSRVGFDMIGTVFGAGLAGWLIDKFADTGPWGLLAMIVLGFVAGMANVWRALGSTKSKT